jgi:flagellar biosynthesis/type III secretory pathway protein FliH
VARDRASRRLNEQAEAERRAREQRRTAAQAAYNELRARGYLEALPEGRFILSAMGMNRSAA